jgi:hypothetical protein
MKIIIGQNKTREIKIAERISGESVDWLRQPNETRRTDTEYCINPSGQIMVLGFNMMYGPLDYSRLEE